MGETIKSVASATPLGGMVNVFSGGESKGRAMDAARYGTNTANESIEYGWKRQQEEMEPWKQAGIKALGALQDGSFFQKDPGYQFRLDEGNKALTAALAARGRGGGGAALKELTRYGQGFASNEYQNAFNRTNQLANYGNNASMSLGNFAGQYGQNLANNALGYANASAGAELGNANRQSQMLSGLMGGGAQMGAAMLMSDRNLKTDLIEISKDDIQEMKKHLKAFYFKYVGDNSGESWAGVMAQDLAKSRVGKMLVSQNNNGNLVIDMKKLMSMFLATMAGA